MGPHHSARLVYVRITPKSSVRTEEAEHCFQGKASSVLAWSSPVNIALLPIVSHGVPEMEPVAMSRTVAHRANHS